MITAFRCLGHVSLFFAAVFVVAWMFGAEPKPVTRPYWQTAFSAAVDAIFLFYAAWLCPPKGPV